MFTKPTITDLGAIVARTLDGHTPGSVESFQKTLGIIATDAHEGSVISQT
jgi:hypothetical protein